MPISVLKDCLYRYSDKTNFKMRADMPLFELTGGRYLPWVREGVADRNFDAFHADWNVNFASIGRVTEGNVTSAMARRVNLPASKMGIFEDLWHFVWEAKSYKKDVDDAIHADLQDAYDLAARVASGMALSGNHLTWDRITDAPPGPNYVVFSDHHMMDHTDDFTLPNYFKDHNLELYLDVLNVYADTPSWCLIENGDVEECIIYETDVGDAQLRRQQTRAKRHYPITQTDPGWDAFMSLRYTKRQAVLGNLFNAFADYYTLIRSRFIQPGRYVRLTGNHDTYSDTERERVLRDMIEDELGTQVHDVARIRRNGQISHLVMHGHQFDTVSIQSGSIPYALSLGETFSETLSWLYEGPDRFWPDRDCRAWLAGGSIGNTLAHERPSTYGYDAMWNLLNAGTETARRKIKENTGGFIETLLGHEIAWEYFENTDKYLALALEVLTGDEWIKFRHLNEEDLCLRYASRYVHHAGLPLTGPIPKLVVGHTHEPRLNASHPNAGPQEHYINTGSAGRFENLIWAVEITPGGDRVVSWSRVKGQLRKTIWRDVHDPLPVPATPLTPARTIHTSKLEHDRYEYF